MRRPAEVVLLLKVALALEGENSETEELDCQYHGDASHEKGVWKLPKCICNRAGSS